jgi:hypothetical protein
MTTLFLLSLPADMAAAVVTYDSLFTGSILLTLGMVLFFAVIPRKPALRNYRVARYVAGGTCLLLALMRLAGYLYLHLRATPAVEMAVAVMQAYLFTFAPVMLLDIQTSLPRRILPGLISAVALGACVFAAVTDLSRELFMDIFWFVASCYIGLLVYFAFLFRKHFLQYLIWMDNFYADEQRELMYWTCVIFAAAVLHRTFRGYRRMDIHPCDGGNIPLRDLCHTPCQLRMGVQYA